MAAKKNVLFLCTGNSARSQMAEAFLRKHAGTRFDVYSAGLNPTGINPYTIRVMDEVGIDIRSQTSDHVNNVAGLRYYEYIVTVCDHAQENCPAPILAMGKHKLHWSFDDPAAVSGNEVDILDAFRNVRDQIDTRLREWLKSPQAMQRR